ncbi:MAG: lytic transglycosylase domain-containing protein [Nitrospirae bacterium]|nr:lytic transglycosylase domain-containing protein [Nitrospirota bacterium]
MKASIAQTGVEASKAKQPSLAAEQAASQGSVKDDDTKNASKRNASAQDNSSIIAMESNTTAGKKEEKSSKSKAIEKYEALINESAQKYGVDPALIKAVIKAESGGEPKALSYAGAKGLMQLMPSTAAGLGVKNSFDPRENIMGGTRYLRQLLDRYNGDVRLTLAAYNWGMGNLERTPQKMPSETRNYITRVENYQREFAEEVAPAGTLMA